MPKFEEIQKLNEEPDIERTIQEFLIQIGDLTNEMSVSDRQALINSIMARLVAIVEKPAVSIEEIFNSSVNENRPHQTSRVGMLLNKPFLSELDLNNFLQFVANQMQILYNKYDSNPNRYTYLPSNYQHYIYLPIHFYLSICDWLDDNSLNRKLTPNNKQIFRAEAKKLCLQQYGKRVHVQNLLPEAQKQINDSKS